MTIMEELQEVLIQEIAADVLQCRQFCETCGRDTNHVSKMDDEEWERFTCDVCGNSHAVRTG